MSGKFYTKARIKLIFYYLVFLSDFHFLLRKVKRRHIFLVTNYINDWRGMALWEPFVSEVSSYVISRLRRIGYEILDVRRMTQSRMDDSIDGVIAIRILVLFMNAFLSCITTVQFLQQLWRCS